MMQNLKKKIDIMTHKWQRLPYLLARRLAITMQLLEILEGRYKTEMFCSALQRASPLEIPLALRSKTWTHQVCELKEPTDNLTALLMAGVDASLLEISFLFEIAEKASFLGSLALKLDPLPLSFQGSGDLWLKLTPTEEVLTNIEALVRNSIHKPDKKSERKSGCWNPIFSGDNQHMPLGQNLGLLGDHSLSLCHVGDELTPETVSNYITTSIIGETSFPINNLSAVKLRLPTGSYNFTLSSASPNPLLEGKTDSPVVSEMSGKFIWAQQPIHSTISKDSLN
jgi:hypothetical protein